MESAEAAELLTRKDRAVLGTRDKLLWPRADGVQWNPGDDLCLAGEVIAQRAADPWILDGSVESWYRCCRQSLR